VTGAATPPPALRAWPFPWAEDRVSPPILSRRAWILLVAVLLLLHFGALLAATRIGNFDSQPNRDHAHGMRQILRQGYPTVTWWPPGFAYYMAGKTLLTRALGLPYWAGKLLLDPLVFVAAGVLSTRLGLLLTRHRGFAVASGLVLASAPLFALASAEDLAELLFQPFFLAALWLLVRELQREGGPTVRGLLAAGATVGLATLVRGNSQFLLLALAPVLWWVARQRGSRRPIVAAAWMLGIALCAQALVQLPWALVQRRSGASGLMAANVFYRSFYNGMARQRGFRIGDEVRISDAPNDNSVRGLVRFHLRWLREDPVALARIYAVKLTRAWYLSSSGRWNRHIAVLHAPIWVLSFAGAVAWAARARADPALWLALSVIGYMWLVASLASGLARYTASLYGLLGMLACVPVLLVARRAGRRLAIAGSPDARDTAGVR
jgi:4-amino-4-deoxy-L-arabinose transferase-like glycosyltransferase